MTFVAHAPQTPIRFMQTAKLSRTLIALFFAPLMTSSAQNETEHADIIAQQQFAGHMEAWRRYAFLGIPKVANGPVIDGTVDASEWDSAAMISYGLRFHNSLSANDRIRWRICYTDTHFYVAFQLARPEGARAPGLRDFVELLFDIDHGHKKYHNIALGLEEELWSGIGPSVDKTAWSPEYEYKARVTDDGWEGEWAVAFSEFNGLDGAPEAGTVWGADFVRNERTPTDRLANWSWRSKWGVAKDLCHLMFTGRPVAIQVEDAGWMPDAKEAGLRIQVKNGSTEPVKLDAVLDVRGARKAQPMEFLQALDSAFTEDLTAAIGARLEDEIASALKTFEVVDESVATVEVAAGEMEEIVLAVEDSPGNYLAGFRIDCIEDSGKSLLAAMNVPFVVTAPLEITLNSYLYSAGVLGYAVDLRSIQKEAGPGTTLSVRVELTGTGEVVGTGDFTDLVGKDSVDGEFAFEPLSGAEYSVVAEAKNDGKSIASSFQKLDLAQKPDWVGGPVGRSKFVPKPWKDLIADVDGAKTLTIDYAWSGRAIFPDVIVKGQEIFAGPMQLELRDGKGAVVPLDVTEFRFDRGDIENATYSFTADAGSLGTLTGTVEVSFDGFLWYNVTLTPSEPVELSSAIFRAKLKPEHAQIYTFGHTGDLPYDSGAGRIPDEGMRMPFTFQTWIGYVEGGLQWYAENPKNWHNEDARSVIRVEPESDGTTLSVRFVDKAIKVSDAITWEFGLLPTPAKIESKPIEEEAYFQIAGVPSLEPPDETLKETDPNLYDSQRKRQELLTSGLLKERGVSAVIVFTTGNHLFGYPGLDDPKQKADLHRFVEEMHRQGIKVLHYNGWGMTIHAPEWEEFSSELVNRPLKNSGWNTYWGSPVSLYNDLFVQRVADHMEEFDLDGIYMDSTLGIEYSTHPNGMRWYDDDGNERGSYPVRAMRDFALRLYKVLNGEVVEGGVFYNHHSPPANVAVENFTNVRCPSEFAQFYTGPLNEEFVDFFLAKNGGIQFGYHAELTNKNWMPAIQKSLNELNAVAVPLNVSFKTLRLEPTMEVGYGRMDQPQPSLWAAFEWLGSKDAVHYPWWKNESLMAVTPKEETLSAVWLRKGEKALVCVSNLVDGSRDLTVSLDLEAMGFANVELADAITGEAIELKGSSFIVVVEPIRWRMIKIWSQ